MYLPKYWLKKSPECTNSLPDNWWGCQFKGKGSKVMVLESTLVCMS